jgi:hypothetical protein
LSHQSVITAASIRGSIADDDSDVTPDRPRRQRFQHDAMTAPLQFDHQ